MTVLEILNTFYIDVAKTFIIGYQPVVYNIQNTGGDITIGLRLNVYGDVVKQFHTLKNTRYVVKELIDNISNELLGI